MQAPIPTTDTARLAIIGLGYVGLPLAVAFGRRYETIGFDIDERRIEQLRAGVDITRETDIDELRASEHLSLSSDIASLGSVNVFIVTVPTPVDKFKRPDLRPLESASRTVGDVLQPGSIVIYESTVYPGATEDVCVPILEERSGLKLNRDFYAGYSPERINPGDKEHVLKTIIKVTSGSTPEAADFVDALYGSIISAGTHKASSIKVAEAAKVIENTQRDLNIALVNELALIFHRLDIDTLSVLEAAGTKWNFLPFRPGLVGGHCIGIDPYYLTHKAQELGYHPEVILAGRRINDDMGEFIADRVIKLITKRGMHIVGSKILVMGLTFKENCPDIRNTRVIDVIKALKTFSADVDVYDPWAAPEETKHEYGIDLTETPEKGTYDAIVITVPHNDFKQMGAEKIRALGKPGGILFDVKCMLPMEESDGRL